MLREGAAAATLSSSAAGMQAPAALVAHGEAGSSWVDVAALERGCSELGGPATPSPTPAWGYDAHGPYQRLPVVGQQPCLAQMSGAAVAAESAARPALPPPRRQHSGCTGGLATLLTSRHAFRWSLAMLCACLVAALLLGALLAEAPMLHSWRQFTQQQEEQLHQQQQEGLGDFHPEELIRELQEHVRHHGPADDFFPAGCRWRALDPVPATGFSSNKASARATWRMQRYEYWDEAAGAWTPNQPAACRLCSLPLREWQAGSWQQQAGGKQQDRHHQQQQRSGRELLQGGGLPGAHPAHHQQQLQPAEPHWVLGGPASGGGCVEAYCLYTNLWYNSGRFYFLGEGGRAMNHTWLMSRHRSIQVLNVRNASTWLQAVDARVVPGETAAVDFIFYLHPTAIGHWLESMFPLFSALLHGPRSAIKRTPDRLMVLYQKRGFIFGWVRALMAVALGIKPGEPPPPLILQQEHDDPWQQWSFPPEGVTRTEWLCFEKVLFVKDIFVNGTRGFQDRRDAQLFRRLMYEQYAIPFPAPGAPPPALITFQRKSANRRVVNEAELLGMLREFGEVRVVEFGGGTPFREQLATMASTGVYISVHTSNLANTPFLPPGAAVFEIIQRNWNWADIDQSFAALTRQLGDIHHYAWRAQWANQTVYSHPRLAELFSGWNATQCVTNECVEAHTLVDVVADVAALRRLMTGRLGLIRKGATVEQARLPWPRAK